jgi:hypothetical protein
MDFAMIAALYMAASQIDTYFGKTGSVLAGPAGQLAKAAAWCAYCASLFSVVRLPSERFARRVVPRPRLHRRLGHRTVRPLLRCTFRD